MISKVSGKTPPKKHRCTSHQKGDWIVHQCPECDYEMWDNYKTGEMKVKNAKADINHSGFYTSPELDSE